MNVTNIIVQIVETQLGENCDGLQLCDNCNDNTFNMCEDCDGVFCIDCTYVRICELCSTGQCEDCAKDDTGKFVYFCECCEQDICTECIPEKICEECDNIVCNNCVDYCNAKCVDNKIHCKPCSNVFKFDNKICKNINCKICTIYCKVYDRNLCIDCHNKDDICKLCKSYFILYKMNNLYRNLPNEIVYDIVNLIKI